MTRIQRGDRTRAWRDLLSVRRASVTILATVLLPVFLGFGLLSAGTGYLYYRKLLLTQTVSAATLAAASNLTTYYTSGTNSTAAIVAAAQTFALANEPSATYGTAVPAADVVVGNWNSTTSAFTSLASSGGTMLNAVQVTGLHTAANGNAVPVFFGGAVGMPTKDLTVTAVASYATGQNFDTIIINDLSQSFKSEITEQRTADLAILNCVETSSSSTSTFGITTIDGDSSIYQALLQASTNLSSLETKINALDYCGQSGMPACSGSDVASGIYSAIQQFSTVSSTMTKKNIIIITDGVPNAKSGTTYTTADGIYPTPTSTTPTCTTGCTDANLLTMAQNQASDAYAAGISISTIYYAGDTATGSQASYAASLATLKRGTGVSLVAPTAATITTVLGGFCSTMASGLKLVQ
jgi:Flp pilus assembly protein TadG